MENQNKTYWYERIFAALKDDKNTPDQANARAKVTLPLLEEWGGSENYEA